MSWCDFCNGTKGGGGHEANCPGVRPIPEVQLVWSRLVAACRTVVRQADDPKSGVIGHDAVVELHRALKAAVPGLTRSRLDKEADAVSHSI